MLEMSEMECLTARGAAQGKIIWVSRAAGQAPRAANATLRRSAQAHKENNAGGMRAVNCVER